MQQNPGASDIFLAYWFEGPNGDFTVSRQTSLANSSQSTVKNAG